MIISFICSLIVFLIDQLTKILIYGTPSRSIIGNLLWFESTLNTGVAFSMFKDSSNVFIFTSAIAVFIIGFFIINNRVVKDKKQKICLGFILGGTFSNLVDRIIFGGVRDFIYLKFINFAIFNIADMAISFGAGFLCFFILFSELIDYKKNKEENETTNEEKSNHENLNLKDNYTSEKENSEDINIEREENINNVDVQETKKEEYSYVEDDSASSDETNSSNKI